jgi:predicted SprT family Zn-dependent metalloprotease
MNRREILTMATDLMTQHGLIEEGWRPAIDSAKRRAGVCKYATRTLSFSLPIALLNTEVETRDTILHEIAHALVGHSHGHDAVWRAKAREIGCNGQRTTKAQAPEAPWTGVHSGCDQKFPRHRRPSGNRYCPKCYTRPAPRAFAALDDLLGSGLGDLNAKALLRWVPTATLKLQDAKVVSTD